MSASTSRFVDLPKSLLGLFKTVTSLSFLGNHSIPYPAKRPAVLLCDPLAAFFGLGPVLADVFGAVDAA